MPSTPKVTLISNGGSKIRNVSATELTEANNANESISSKIKPYSYNRHGAGPRSLYFKELRVLNLNTNFYLANNETITSGQTVRVSPDQVYGNPTAYIFKTLYSINGGQTYQAIYGPGPDNFLDFAYNELDNVVVTYSCSLVRGAKIYSSGPTKTINFSAVVDTTPPTISSFSRVDGIVFPGAPSLFFSNATDNIFNAGQISYKITSSPFPFFSLEQAEAGNVELDWSAYYVFGPEPGPRWTYVAGPGGSSLNFALIIKDPAGNKNVYFANAGPI